MARHLLAVATALALTSGLLAGCGLPTSGPAGQDVISNPREPELPYCLVQVTAPTISVLAKHLPRLSRSFADGRAPTDVRIGIGDVISVTVFEAAAGGLFIPAQGGLRQGNFITLPNQTVDNTGNMSVPYAGLIKAKDRTVVEIQKAIVDALKDRALEPQAVVTLVEQRSSLISILGEVNQPTRVPASASGERVLDVITRAGGPRAPGYETWVLMERNGQRAISPLDALIYEPANNVYVRAQDTIYLYREPQTFLSFGASGRQGQFPFEQWRLSVAEAIAKSGGLNDSLADPAWVFLYRGEPRKVLQDLGVSCPKVEGDIVPVIYQVNLRDPSGFFLAGQLMMRNKDIVYVSNARAVEATKFMTFIRQINGTINDPINTAIDSYSLKSAINGTASTIITTGGGTTP